jgi:cyclophilin family peptidyl-prolyl cis-trans isomerase
MHQIFVLIIVISYISINEFDFSDGVNMRIKMLLTLLVCFILTSLSCGKKTVPNPVVILNTNLGDIELTLDANKAPVSVENFVKYVNEGFYDSTIIHRVVPRFVVQGGGYDTFLKEKTTHEPIKNESGNGLSNIRGSLAMARSNAPNSATSQFYINLKNNTQLDEMKYAVFGQVTGGMAVVDSIAARETNDIGDAFTNFPVKTIIIIKASLKK